MGRSDAEAPMLSPPDAKSRLTGKDPDAGKDWGREEKGTAEDEMVGWHHPLDGPEFEQAPGVGDGQGGLACRGPWGRKESDTSEQPDNGTCRRMLAEGEEKPDRLRNQVLTFSRISTIFSNACCGFLCVCCLFSGFNSPSPEGPASVSFLQCKAVPDTGFVSAADEQGSN